MKLFDSTKSEQIGKEEKGCAWRDQSHSNEKNNNTSHPVLPTYLHTLLINILYFLFQKKTALYIHTHTKYTTIYQGSSYFFSGPSRI